MQLAVQQRRLAGGDSSHSSEERGDSSNYWRGVNTSQREVDWRVGADHSTTSTEKSSSSDGLKELDSTSSLLFQYFSLLATYHGAVHVPRYWEELLFPSPVAETVGGRTSTMEHGRKEVDGLISPATEIDLGVCYAGPTILLALADLLRVHSVTVPTSYCQRQLLSTKRGMAALPTVMAPLWGAGSRRARKENEVMCSFLPHLRTLRLAHLSIDFSSPHKATALKDGCAVLRSLLEALQGHPSIEVLDISGNPIAAGLVPTLSRLVQTTPSLTTLVLDDTLLADDEKEMLHTQCLLNELRKQCAAAEGNSVAVFDDSSPLACEKSDTRVLWLAQMREKVLMAVERGVSALPSILGKYTALIRSYDPAQATRGIAAALEQTTATSQSSSNTQKTSTRGTRSASVFTSADLSSSSARAYVKYDYGSDCGGAASFTVSPPPGSTWSEECVEVVRSAFMPQSMAQSTVLGGRPVWSNVPGPLEGSNSKEQTAPSIAAVAATDLMLSLRQQVLPEPEMPRGIRRRSTVAADFLTTAEDNYWSTQRKQELQWGYVVQKIVENLTPVSVRNGETLYMEGDACDMMYLLPVSLHDTGTYAELHAGVDPPRINRVLPGQWVGDAEVLDCVSMYARHQSPADEKGAARLTSVNHFQRCSTVKFFTEASDDVVIWALPFSVAFFYLYVPYRLLHAQFIKRTPMTAFADIHPVLLSCVPVHLHARHGCWQAATAEGEHRGAAETLCSYAFMSRHVLLLEEGEFLLRMPLKVSVLKRRKDSESGISTAVVMGERHLLSGVTVLTQSLLDLDAGLRESAAAEGATEDTGESLGGARGPQGMEVLGKEAALARFRAIRAALVEADDARSHSAGSEALSPVGNEGSGIVSDADLVQLCQHCTGGPGVQWRFSALANEEFMSLCPALRIALTHHHCVVHHI
ncbi:hypothetical protein JKF63_03230 [Porcisia hertigi]|uniref:Uncharacterized protein n=1 Tax=Porcisia hertigi TaxID=2761500 RepID=A0A836HK97_9TRYP|nr:hypothetical protein JKF63_03230 [Porcisia hertigi]